MVTNYVSPIMHSHAWLILKLTKSKGGSVEASHLSKKEDALIKLNTTKS